MHIGTEIIMALSKVCLPISVLITLCSCLPSRGAEALFERNLVIIDRLHEAEAQFKSSRGRYGTLAELASVDLIASDVASGRLPGSRICVTPGDHGYTIKVIPRPWGISGRTSLYSDETKVLRISRSPLEASSESPVLPVYR